MSFVKKMKWINFKVESLNSCVLPASRHPILNVLCHEQLLWLGHEPAAAKVVFKWKRVVPTEEQIMKIKENTCVGWILEANLEYPEELKKAHNSYPFAPEKKAIRAYQMSNYQKRLIEDLGLDFPKSEN